MSDGLERLREIHAPFFWEDVPVGCVVCNANSEGVFPCETRRIVDEMIGGRGGYTENVIREMEEFDRYHVPVWVPRKSEKVCGHCGMLYPCTSKQLSDYVLGRDDD